MQKQILPLLNQHLVPGMSVRTRLSRIPYQCLFHRFWWCNVRFAFHVDPFLVARVPGGLARARQLQNLKKQFVHRRRVWLLECRKFLFSVRCIESRQLREVGQLRIAINPMAS